jgi:hypothetical protein
VSLPDVTVSATAATLRSSEEINTTTNAFTPTSPAWASGSGPAVTVGGTYDGSTGTTVLTFTAQRSGSNIRLVVTDSGGATIGNLRWGSADASTTPMALANGLTVSLASKAITAGNSFTVSVSAGPQSPNVDAAFNAAPNLEPGASVTNGSFSVNGATIDVYASDSISSVLARITASDAGVTATYDTATEGVVLTQKTAGATPSIVLGSDTSGFLAATKLADATVEAGTDGTSSLDEPMAAVAELAGVSAGTIIVNGASIAIDPTTMSLYAVLAAIEAAAPQVSASRSDATGEVTITRVAGAATLTLDSGATGFFAALGIADGTYEGSRGVSSFSSTRAAEALRDVQEAFTEVYDDDTLGLSGTASIPAAVYALRATLATTVEDRFGSARALDTGFGLTFAFATLSSGERTGEMTLAHDGTARFARALRQRTSTVREFFLAPTAASEGPLLEQMLDAAKRAAVTLREAAG